MLQRDAGAAHDAIIRVLRELRDNARAAINEFRHLAKLR